MPKEYKQREYKSQIDISAPLDMAHYKKLWQIAMFDTGSDNLYRRLEYAKIICSPNGFDMGTLPQEFVEKYLWHGTKDSIIFINDYNTFICDSWLSCMRLVTFARWRKMIDNLNKSPMHSIKNDVRQLEDWLHVWMFKHSMHHVIYDKNF